MPKERIREKKRFSLQARLLTSTKMMYHRRLESLCLQLVALLTIWSKLSDCLIYTSVIAGDKKFKTVSFDHKWIKPLTWEKELPQTEFRRYRIVRPPKFDVDINIPIKLPLEEEYPYEEPKKPVTSHISFQSGEITEPAYGHAKGGQNYAQEQQKTYEEPKHQYNEPPKQHKPIVYKDEAYVASNREPQITLPAGGNQLNGLQGIYQQPEQQPMAMSRSDEQYLQRLQQPHQQQQDTQREEPLLQAASNAEAYGHQKTDQNSYQDPGPEFVPGGFVNLQLSGPTGGPKPTYEDYDRERWSQQLSQAAGSMPYPILNYHQLQNFYGGLGTFTNGLPDTPYEPHSLVEKLKSSLHHVAGKFHIG